MKQLDRTKLRENLERRINSHIVNETVGAASIFVVQQGETIFNGNYGLEKIGMRVANDTIFRMASMTKPVTAVAALILVDRGLISLEDKVSKYLPEYKDLWVGCPDGENHVRILEPARREIILKHLLTHTSGLGSNEVGVIESCNLTAEHKKSLKNIVAQYPHTALAFHPGEEQGYSPTFAFDVMARVIEIVTGISYDQFLKKEIFEPLGMKDTTFAPTPEQWARVIPMHDYAEGEGKVHPMPENCVFADFPVTYYCAGAGLVSTADDYMKFALMLAGKGSFGGKRILSEKMVYEMSRSQMPGDMSIWGLGVRVIAEGMDPWLPEKTFGWSGAFGTHFWIDPTNEIVAMYLKNSCYDGGAEALTSREFEEDVYRSFR